MGKNACKNAQHFKRQPCSHRVPNPLHTKPLCLARDATHNKHNAGHIWISMAWISSFKVGSMGCNCPCTIMLTKIYSLLGILLSMQWTHLSTLLLLPLCWPSHRRPCLLPWPRSSNLPPPPLRPRPSEHWWRHELVAELARRHTHSFNAVAHPQRKLCNKAAARHENAAVGPLSERQQQLRPLQQRSNSVRAILQCKNPTIAVGHCCSDTGLWHSNGGERESSFLTSIAVSWSLLKIQIWKIFFKFNDIWKRHTGEHFCQHYKLYCKYFNCCFIDKKSFS